MARPMKLIEHELLMELYHKYKDGVPVSKLLIKYDLPLTHPTVSKLISYYALYVKKYEEGEIQLANIVKQSLFPIWSEFSKTTIMQQPDDWKYIGKMPFGCWEQVERNEENV